MYYVIGLLGVALFLAGLFCLPFKKMKISKKQKLLMILAGVVLFITGVAMTPAQKDVETTNNAAVSSSNKKEPLKSETVSKLKDTLQQGDTIAFLKTYYAQPENIQSDYYDKIDAYHSESKVNGTAFRVNSSGTRLYIYVPVEGPESSWDDIINTKQNAYVVIAKAPEGTFSKENVGKNVTVSGRLESRGNLKSGYNWGLYDAKLVD